jgi:hypothetical protein
MSWLMGGHTIDVGVIRLATIAGIVGLDLTLRAYAGGSPLRDRAHGALLQAFRARLHRDLGWGTEVPLPGLREQRAWDAFVRGPGWRYGVEAETHPTDAQALGRRLELKRRDGLVDGVLLVLPATTHVRLFIRAAGDLLRHAFPVSGRRALELLGAGVDPGGGAIIVLCEEGGAASVTEALDLLHIERVDHGMQAIDDPVLMDRLARTGTPLTMCPLSNVRLRCVDTMADHPLPAFLEAGVLVTVNSDDPAYDGGYADTNYEALRATFGFSDEVMAQLARNSVTASFLPEGRKAGLLSEIDAWVAT